MRGYRALLLKYMNHVGNQEGTAFIPCDGEAETCGFTLEEVAELRRLNEEGETASEYVPKARAELEEAVRRSHHGGTREEVLAPVIRALTALDEDGATVRVSATPHSPEPWYVSDWSVKQGDHATYVENSGPRLLVADRDEPRTSPARRDANLRRAAKCVNDCAGIEDPGAAITAARALLRRVHAEGYGVGTGIREDDVLKVLALLGG